MIIQDYLNLVTSEYAEQPNFVATVSFLVSLPVQVQSLLTQMQGVLFNLSTPPVGDQLDIIGEWVGVSRDLQVPISGVYFTWDGSNPKVGWDFGTWATPGAGTQLVVLPDDAYLTLIRAKIAANHWDGTTTGAYAIWSALFPTFTILIQDYCNMSYALAIIGGVVDSVTLALLTGGDIPLRPEGVLISEYFVSTDTNPAFAWDIENTNMKGWDQGSWLQEVFN